MTPAEYLRRREHGLRRSLHARGSALLTDADRRLDLSERIRRHPWLALGAGALAGGLLGGLAARVPVGGAVRGLASPLLRIASAAWSAPHAPHGEMADGTPAD